MRNLETGNFRLLLFYAAIPSIISFYLTRRWMIESPRQAIYLGKKDNFVTSIETLNYIGKTNDANYQNLTKQDIEDIKAYGWEINKQQ